MAKASEFIGKAFGNIFNIFKEGVRSGDFKKFMDLINSGIIGIVLIKLKDFF